MYERLLITNDDGNPIPPEDAKIRSIPTRTLLGRVVLYGSLFVFVLAVGEFQPLGAAHPGYAVSAILGIAGIIMGWPAGAECLRRALLWWRMRGYRSSSDRGQVQVPDAILALVVLVAVIALAPTLYKFVNMAATDADPFSALLLRLSPALLILGLIVSVGVSARRGS